MTKYYYNTNHLFVYGPRLKRGKIDGKQYKTISHFDKIYFYSCTIKLYIYTYHIIYKYIPKCTLQISHFI